MDEVKYGLLGKKLGYSYSKLIYDLLNIDYKLIELDEKKLITFLKEKKFKGVNVTIPYKEKVIPYLDELSPLAKEIGVVNTIVNENGKLVGYNTDYYGFEYLLGEYDLTDIENKDLLILGTGATFKTVKKVLSDKGIKNIKVASSKDGYDYHYDNIKKRFDFVINTTPVGTYPNICDKINVDGVNIIDVTYNPYRTRLAIDSKFKHSGLDMLIVQAIYSMKLFSIENLYIFKEIKDYLLKSTRNIVLVGLTGVGKSTIALKLKEELKRDLIDTDNVIINKYGDIDQIFREFGEKRFREIEKEVVARVSLEKGKIIATGGGVVLDSDNMKRLMANGIIVYLKRDVKDIYNDLKDRPLVKNIDDLIKLEEERRSLYLKYADIVIENNDINKTVNEILDKYLDL